MEVKNWSGNWKEGVGMESYSLLVFMCVFFPMQPDVSLYKSFLQDILRKSGPTLIGSWRNLTFSCWEGEEEPAKETDVSVRVE